MSNLFKKKWDVAFVKGGIDALFADGPFHVEVVKNPFKNHWFADPFVLDVTADKILLLAEEMDQSAPQPYGRIAKLTVDKASMRIEKYDIILDTGTHLSFPNILRQDGKVYIYPENCHQGKLNLYEFDPDTNALTLVQSICDDAVWDASMTDFFGHRQLLGSYQDDFHLDIYDWDEAAQNFVRSHSDLSPKADNRLAGQPFAYKGNYYCPTQDCTTTYGGGVCLKKMVLRDGKLALLPGKVLAPPDPKRFEGLHTLNQYKGVVVVDLKSWHVPLMRTLYQTYRSLAKKK
ncbi:MAG: hypothetical protein IJ785_06635 [Bacteroidales bacterium]|nr:hypothetical protein [Bacteroidales bacterium]